MCLRKNDNLITALFQYIYEMDCSAMSVGLEYLKRVILKLLFLSAIFRLFTSTNYQLLLKL